MRKRWSIIVGILLIANILTGCQGAAKKPATPQQQTPSKTANMDVSASERRVMASRLSKIAQDVTGVDKASVVVTNGTMAGGTGASLVVMVGLTLSAGVAGDAQKINNTKQTVADRIKANDNRIAQVLVTTDPTMIKRINDVAAGIIEGKPIQSYEQDVNNLARELKKSGQSH